MAQNKEIWLSQVEVQGLLQGSLSWEDVCSQNAQPGLSMAVEKDEVDDGDFVSRGVNISGLLSITAALTVASWIYFVFIV